MDTIIEKEPFGHNEKKTILHYACFHGHIDLIRVLLKYGADLESKDAMGWTALRYACARGDLELVRFLAENGADINATSRRLWTCLHSVCGLGDVQCSKFFIEAGAGLELRTMDGLTALHIACAYGQSPQIVQLLLQAGADIEAKDSQGNTALQLACQIGQVQIVETLLTMNCDPFQTKIDKNWAPPLVQLIHTFQERDKSRSRSCKNILCAARALLTTGVLSMELCFHILSFLAHELPDAEIRLLCRVLMDRRSVGHIPPPAKQSWLSLLMRKNQFAVPFTYRALIERCKLYLKE